MEWLKKLLEGIAVGEDGKIDVEEVQNQIQKELPMHFVPKANYNAKADELKEANTTISTLKKANKDNEALQSTIKDHEKTIADLQKQNTDTMKTVALQKALSEKGCKDPDYVIFKQGGLEKFTFSEEGAPVGLDDVIETYKENKILFPTGEQKPNYTPAGGGSGAPSSNPFAKESFNLTEQGKLFKEDPAKAKALAAEAGVEI